MENNHHCVAVDNGLDGGVAWVELRPDGSFKLHEMFLPAAGPKLVGEGRMLLYRENFDMMVSLLGRIKNAARVENLSVECILEDPLMNARGITNKKAIASTYASFLVWQNVLRDLSSLSLKYENPAVSVTCRVVEPKEWQSHFWGRRTKNSQATTKQLSEAFAVRMFPEADFRKSAASRTVHDGFADAALMAVYGIRSKNNQPNEHDNNNKPKTVSTRGRGRSRRRTGASNSAV